MTKATDFNLNHRKDITRELNEGLKIHYLAKCESSMICTVGEIIPDNKNMVITIYNIYI